MKRKIKNIFLEVIFNRKFYLMKSPTTKLLLNLHGELDKKGGLDNVEYGLSQSIILFYIVKIVVEAVDVDDIAKKRQNLI